MPVGSKIKFKKEKLCYVVRASNTAYLVCTRPLNMIVRMGGKKYKHEKTVVYTIVDFVNRRRGPENLIFGMGAETDESCVEMLERVTAGDSAVSDKRDVDLDIEKVYFKL